MGGRTKSDAILFTAMPIIYDMQGYPHFVVDFAERRPDGARKTVQAAMLLVRSFFDEGEQRMTSIDDIDIGTPANGWTIRFTGVTGAQPPEAYIATYRNGQISYNEDPNRQAASMSERVWYAVDFAKGKGGSKGSGKTKNCTKGKLCGGSCIAKGRNCRIEANASQKKAADALSKADPADLKKLKAGAGEIAKQRVSQLTSEIDGILSRIDTSAKEYAQEKARMGDYIARIKGGPADRPVSDLISPQEKWDSPKEAIAHYQSLQKMLDRNAKQLYKDDQAEIKRKEAEIASLQRGPAKFIYEGRNVTVSQLRQERDRIQRGLKELGPERGINSEAKKMIRDYDADLNRMKGKKDDDTFTDSDGFEYPSVKSARETISYMRKNMVEGERRSADSRNQERIRKIAQLRTFDDNLKSIQQGREPNFDSLRDSY
jgi:hypothetical protein